MIHPSPYSISLRVSVYFFWRGVAVFMEGLYGIRQIGYVRIQVLTSMWKFNIPQDGDA